MHCLSEETASHFHYLFSISEYNLKSPTNPQIRLVSLTRHWTFSTLF